MERSSEVLVIPALLTVDVIAVIVVLATSLSKYFTSAVDWGILGVSIFIANLVAGELTVRYWERPHLSLASIFPSRVELTFLINGKPVRKEMNALSVKLVNEGRRTSHSPAVVLDAVNLARGGGHFFLDFNREFHHPTFLPIQTVTADPTERELAYLVFQISKENPAVEGGEQGSFLIGYSFVQTGADKDGRVYLPSETHGEPYPMLPGEALYVEMYAQSRGSRIRPVSSRRYVLKASRWGEPLLTETSSSLEESIDEFRASRYVETSPQMGT